MTYGGTSPRRSGLLAAIVLCLAAFALANAAQGRSLQQIRNAGNLRVGVTLAAPWALRREGGELDGFELDVAKRLAADLKVTPEFVLYRFDELVTALETGEVDIVVSGLTITPESALHVNFSRPHTVGGVAIATNLSATREVENFEALNDADFTVGAIEDSDGAQVAAAVLPRARLALFDDPLAAAEALVAGTVDAYLDELPAPTFLSLEYTGLIDVPIARPLLETRTGFAIGKGDADFVTYLNAWIEAREADTFLPSTYRYWFETLRWRED